MKSTRIFLGVATALLAATTAARACKYCWAAAADGQDLAQISMQMHGTKVPPGDFPLDGAISNFQPSGAPVALTTPPPAGSIATSAAELRPPGSTAATTSPAVSASPAPAVAAAPHAVASSAAAIPGRSVRWADVGLLGMAAAGGLFCWRTRRATGSVH